MDTIAAEKLIFVHPDGTRTSGTIRIGKPYEVSGGEARCPVAMEGLHDDLSDITHLLRFSRQKRRHPPPGN